MLQADHHRTRTSAGEAYHDLHDETVLETIDLVPVQAGVFAVDVHGDKESFGFDQRRFGPHDMARLIRAGGNWNGEPIRLVSCETAQGERPIAQELADELGVAVTAPTESVWVDSSGVHTSTVSYNEFDELIATEPHDGRWITFTPKEGE